MLGRGLLQASSREGWGLLSAQGGPMTSDQNFPPPEALVPRQETLIKKGCLVGAPGWRSR